MNQEKIGQFIKNIRIKNNLTQKEFAKKLNVTFQAVSKWENGKSIPDIATLNEIKKMFNVDIDEILEAKPKKKKMNRPFLIITIFLIIIVSLITILFNNNSAFNFSKLTTTCDNFTINGSAAYNKDKTAIYISNISFCGEDDKTIYDEIKCTLYEEYNNNQAIIGNSKPKNNLTLKKFLDNTEINVESYSSICKSIEKSTLYITINATLNNKITSYKIPINLDSEC